MDLRLHRPVRLLIHECGTQHHHPIQEQWYGCNVTEKVRGEYIVHVEYDNWNFIGRLWYDFCYVWVSGVEEGGNAQSDIGWIFVSL